MMKALSLKQPWAWIVLRPDITDPALRAAAFASEDIKPIENRKWRTNFRGPVLIHASLQFDTEGYNWIRANFPHIPLPAFFRMYQTGGIVGQVRITDCVAEHDSPWFFGPYGFTLKDAEPLPFLPCRGMLNFFVPDLTPSQWVSLLERVGQ